MIYVFIQFFSLLSLSPLQDVIENLKELKEVFPLQKIELKANSKKRKFFWSDIEIITDIAQDPKSSDLMGSSDNPNEIKVNLDKHSILL